MKSPKPKPRASPGRSGFPLLYLEWIDPGRITNGGDWLTRENIEEEARPEKFINKTVGWLLQETKTDLVICAQIATARYDDDELFDLAMFIPKSLIRVRRVLKEK